MRPVRASLKISVAITIALTACSEGSTNEGTSSPAHTEPTLDVELTRRWWEWAVSEPATSNPVLDATGADCLRGQPDDVFFLAGSFGTTETRRCEVPYGIPLLISVLNMVCEATSTDCGFPPEASKNATLDDEVVQIINVASRSPVTVNSAVGNPVFPDADGSVSVQVGGDWVLLPSLGRGSHELRAWGGFGTFSLDVTYHLNVP